MKKLLNKLEKEIKPLFNTDSSGHDFYHLKRVLNLALHIQEKEGGDRLVIAVSAFLHDFHRIIQNKTGKYCSPQESLPKIKKILEKINIPKNKIEKILHCIEFHEEYSFTKQGKTVFDIETLIVQDADDLDAMGAVGIGRCFAFGGSHKIPMWNSKKININNLSKFNDSNIDPSSICHFYTKLLNLKDNMNTKTAKKMALRRHKFMEKFLDEFFHEWEGET